MSYLPASRDNAPTLTFLRVSDIQIGISPTASVCIGKPDHRKPHLPEFPILCSASKDSAGNPRSSCLFPKSHCALTGKGYSAVSTLYFLLTLNSLSATVSFVWHKTSSQSMAIVRLSEAKACVNVTILVALRSECEAREGQK